MLRGPLLRAVGSVSLALIMLTRTARAESPVPLTPFQFLIGQWEGIGDQAGATGGFTFAPGVQDRVIVRTNYSNTPASGGKPASRHDDLMVIYVEAASSRPTTGKFEVPPPGQPDSFHHICRGRHARSSDQVASGTRTQSGRVIAR
jgi:hypothetical protein